MTTANHSTDDEIWRTPHSLNCPRIEVSNLGRVRTRDFKKRFIRMGKCVSHNIKGRILRIGKDTRGRYVLCGSQIKKQFYGKIFLVHRLVAECFVHNKNPEKYKWVFFKDGNISNCKASNLEWGNKEDWGKIQSIRRAKYRIKVLCNGLLVGEFDGYGETGRALGTSKQSIQHAISYGHLCRGFQLVRTEIRGEKPYFGIEKLRKSKQKRLDTFEIPNELYTHDIVKIKHKAVF